MPEPDDRTLQSEARLARLAGRCPVLQGAVCALSLALVVLALGGADALNRVKSVELNEIVLRDHAGKMRGWVGVGADGNARFSIFDREGNEAVVLGVAPDGATVVYLSRGDRVVTVGVDAGRVPRIELVGEGKGGASFFYRPDLASGVYLRDKQGNARLNTGLAAGGAPQVIAFDADQKMRVALGTTPDASTHGLCFLDEHEEQRLALGLNPERAAFADLYQHAEKGARMVSVVAENGMADFTIQDRFARPRIALALFGQGTETLFRVDDGSDENGITLRHDDKGRIYQEFVSKAKRSAIHLGIDEQGVTRTTFGRKRSSAIHFVMDEKGVNRMQFAEKETPPSLELSAEPGSQALFLARDAQGKERARAGVNQQGRAEMRRIGERASEKPDRSEPAEGKDRGCHNVAGPQRAGGS